MASPTAIVAYLALFASVAAVFLFANLLVGRLVRPRLPNPEKLEIYECGEPVIGSSFVQFDLRFYVVALLFIIFDVEIAFFFPWATVFGKAAQLNSPDVPVVSQTATSWDLTPTAVRRLQELGVTNPQRQQFLAPANERVPPAQNAANNLRATANKIALTSMADIGVFFAVLLVGFAYVWKRGDLDWVRAVTSQQGEVVQRASPTAVTPQSKPASSVLSAP